MPKRIRIMRPERGKGYSSDGLTLEFDAGELATRLAAKVAQAHREAIREGREASGSSQRSLGPDEARRAARGKRSRARGMGSEGRFADSIGSTRAKGSTKASADVAADPYFDDWQGRESARGVEYFHTDGDVEDLIDEALSDALDEMFK